MDGTSSVLSPRTPSAPMERDTSCCYGCFDCGFLGKISWIALYLIGVAALFFTYEVETALAASFLLLIAGAGLRWLCFSSYESAAYFRSYFTWIPFTSSARTPVLSPRLLNRPRSIQLHYFADPISSSPIDITPPCRVASAPLSLLTMESNTMNRVQVGTDTDNDTNRLTATPQTISSSTGSSQLGRGRVQVGSDLSGSSRLSGTPSSSSSSTTTSLSRTTSFTSLSSNRQRLPPLQSSSSNTQHVQVASVQSSSALSGTPSSSSSYSSSRQHVQVESAQSTSKLSGGPSSSSSSSSSLKGRVAVGSDTAPKSKLSGLPQNK